MNRLRKAILLAKELGISQLVPYASYQSKLRAGLIQRQTPAGGWNGEAQVLPPRNFRIPLPSVARYQLKAAGIDSDAVLHEAEGILAGNYRPFGGSLAPLTFDLPQSQLLHWTQYGSTFAGQDIKLTWEPARFTWAYTLIEAHALTNDERFAEHFWLLFEQFVKNNPVNLGPNWASAQEVALRALPLLFALKTFGSSPSTNKTRLRNLTSLLLQSALRILPTMEYARAQNNNHLLSESLGLIVLGTFFTDTHPAAPSWVRKGFVTFEHALQKQLEPDGTYSQHSMIYHRMMLQLALIYCGYAQYNKRPFSIECRSLLCSATQWLAAQVDRSTGDAPNLGHNDGTLLLPFGASNFRDFRPTLQAAGLAFVGRPAYDSGPWDDLAIWLGLPSPDCQPKTSKRYSPSPSVHRVGSAECWGTLRAVKFHSRPAHADQLCVDVWWHGHNIAIDAGTYLYNADPPWDNQLARTCVHNTLAINGEDQMVRAGRFLWLDRIDAQVIHQMGPNIVSGQMRLHSAPAIHHTRTLAFTPEKGFTVTDEVAPLVKGQDFSVDLQWLLPDWSYTLLERGIHLQGEEYTIDLSIDCLFAPKASPAVQVSLIRGGITLEGDLQNPLRGWVSGTYAQKSPALSFMLRLPVTEKIVLTSEWVISARAGNSR